MVLEELVGMVSMHGFSEQLAVMSCHVGRPFVFYEMQILDL